MKKHTRELVKLNSARNRLTASRRRLCFFTQTPAASLFNPKTQAPAVFGRQLRAETAVAVKQG
jgi:hypothetical protein